MTIRRSEIALLAQAAAIVLPVAALSGIALHYLRDDKAAIETDARDRAQATVSEIAIRLQKGLKGIAQDVVPAAIKGGQPVVLQDYPQMPEPTSRQSAGAIELRKLESAEKTGASDLVTHAVSLAQRLPQDVTPSGTPVSGLALLLALRHVNGRVMPAELIDALRRNTRESPSFLTAEVLRTAAAVAGEQSAPSVAAIADQWKREETSREDTRAVVRKVAARLVGVLEPSAVFIDTGQRKWLALADPAPDGWTITLFSGAAVGVPQPYMGLALDIDQAQWRIVGPEIAAPAILAAGAPDTVAGHRYRVTVDLAYPQRLYGPYEQRRKLTEGLIFCAAATALIGLTTLWIGYRRQARLSAMKSNFVSSVSHELRAPLAAVRLMAESLEGGRIANDGKRQDYYRLIVQECRRLSGLVENVLDLSRIGDGRKRYRFEPVDVAALVRQSVALMEPCAAERQVSLRLADLAVGDWHAVWDGHAVEQSLVNLLDNAIKHSPPGADVRVEVERESNRMRLWVEDRGPGIPSREQKRIFEMFYRHGSELRRETKGAGIGLSIVQHVAEAHGGRVIVESQMGSGSRFALELPVECRP